MRRLLCERCTVFLSNNFPNLLNFEIYLQRTQTLWWITTLSAFVAIEALYETMKSELVVRAIYAAAHRIAWVTLLCWIVYACHHLRSGGFVNRFLSLRSWQPFSRMSLSIYLIHMIYIILTVVSMKELWFIESAWMIHIVLGDFVAPTFFGVILYLMVESPSNALIQCYLKWWITF